MLHHLSGDIAREKFTHESVSLSLAMKRLCLHVIQHVSDVPRELLECAKLDAVLNDVFVELSTCSRSKVPISQETEEIACVPPDFSLESVSARECLSWIPVRTTVGNTARVPCFTGLCMKLGEISSSFWLSRPHSGETPGNIPVAVLGVYTVSVDMMIKYNPSTRANDAAGTVTVLQVATKINRDAFGIIPSVVAPIFEGWKAPIFGLVSVCSICVSLYAPHWCFCVDTL